MPTAPRHPCRAALCPKLAPSGQPYCEDHASEGNRWRGTTTERGYGASWQRIRLRVLKGEPLCRRCAAKGLAVPARDVHHRDENPHNNARGNLEPLCRQCHEETKRREGSHGH